MHSCCRRSHLLNKGTKGKLRPLGSAATFRRVAYGALVRAEAAQYAVGRKGALESLSRDTQAAIKTKCNAAVAQFDCSSAFNHADRTMILSHIRHLSPHLARSLYNILSRTTLNLVRKEDGSTMLVPSNDGLTHCCPAAPAAFSFLILLVEEFFWSELVARAGEEAKAVTDLYAHLDDLTLVTEVRFLEDAIRATEPALAKARLIVNEMKGTVWTSTGRRPDGMRAGAVWDNVEGHEGFVLSGCLGAVDDQSSQAPTPIPLGNSSYIERFFQKRAEVIRGLSQHIQEITDHAPAGLPAVQAASCLLRECIPQRSIHLLRVLGSDSTKEFCTSVDETVLEAARRILDLPELLDWQNEALFIPADRSGWGLSTLEQRRHAARLGGMIAAEAPTKRENDALSAAFDVEAFDILRRTPTDLTFEIFIDGPDPSTMRETPAAMAGGRKI